MMLTQDRLRRFAGRQGTGSAGRSWRGPLADVGLHGAGARATLGRFASEADGGAGAMAGLALRRACEIGFTINDEVRSLAHEAMSHAAPNLVTAASIAGGLTAALELGAMHPDAPLWRAAFDERSAAIRNAVKSGDVAPIDAAIALAQCSALPEDVRAELWCVLNAADGRRDEDARDVLRSAGLLRDRRAA